MAVPFVPYKEQQTFPNKRESKGIPALSLAAGLPFHFSKLNDPTGSYLGTTFSGGNVIYDLFHRDKNVDTIMLLRLGQWELVSQHC